MPEAKGLMRLQSPKRSLLVLLGLAGEKVVQTPERDCSFFFGQSRCALEPASALQGFASLMRGLLSRSSAVWKECYSRRRVSKTVWAE